MIGAQTRVDMGGSDLRPTTATDVAGFFAFLGIATLWFCLR
jgi:hypothetical protein